MKRLAWLFLAIGSAGPSVGHTEDYDVFPIKETIQASPDKRYWVVDVVDTTGVKGSLSVDASTGLYDAVWGGVPESGQVATSVIEMETMGVTSAGFPVPVIVGIAVCAVLHARAQSLLAAQTSACYKSGGYPYGGSVGTCGRMTAPACRRRIDHVIVE